MQTGQIGTTEGRIAFWGFVTMTSDIAAFEARQPRHETTNPARLKVEVRRESALPSGPLRAQLLDLSRQGLQLRVPIALELHERIRVGIRDDDARVSISLSGVVRWQKPADDGHYLVGGQFERELDWETMGELFLNDILAMD
jgi:hypothetical protein